MYSRLLETIRRFVFYSNNMPLMNIYLLRGKSGTVASDTVPI